MPSPRSSGDDKLARFLSHAKKQLAADDVAPSQRKVSALLARLFQQQRDFVLDPHKRKSLLCPRRSGKSFAAAAYLFIVCLAEPAANCAFLSGTRDQAKRILWRLLKRLNKELEIKAVPNETELTMTLPSGARIKLGGCETPADIDRWRGEPYHLVLLDESKSFPADLLDELIEEALEPALGDYDGTMAMMGTPGSALAGTFYAATGGAVMDEDGRREGICRPYAQRDDARWSRVDWEWSFHSWAVADNTAIPELWMRALRLKKRKGWADDNPKWIREYLGLWVTDDSERVYAFSDARNLWKPGRTTEGNPFGLPGEHEWTYIMGLDLGFDAQFALQVAAFSDTSNTLYQVYEFAAPGLHVSLIADEIKRVQRICDIDILVGDRGGLGKMVFATLEKEHGISIEAAEKQEKRDHIELLNSDLIDGRCKLLASSQLRTEMLSLVWEDSHKKHEDPKLAKDNCDAWLYIRTRAQHHLSHDPILPPEPGTPAYEQERADRELEALEQQHLRRTEDWESEPDGVAEWLTR